MLQCCGAWEERTEEGDDDDEDGAECHFSALCEVLGVFESRR